MPLKLAFVFHFNQHLNEHGAVASRVCYRGLLTVLRRHPRLKFNLHVSGTLVHALNWLDPEPLDEIRAGLAGGQFELLGSTYSQNIPYVADEWDNAEQIALHRQVLEEFFGVRPAGFWIPERAWRQSLAPVIAGGGYRYTLLEDHILRGAGLDEPRPCSTPAGDGRSLALYWDDETFKHWVNFAAWFGNPEPALNHLRAVADRAGSDDFCLAYAEDAEAMGLWGWQEGIVPNQTWAHLDAFLSLVESQDWLQVVCLGDAPAPTVELPTVPDGWAAWMDASLRRPGAPYHEDGYSDWLDFQARSPKPARFKRLYNAIRVRLRSLQAARGVSGFAAPIPSAETTGAQRLFREAVRALLSHQYEFGCIGVGGKGYRGWEQAVSAFALARAVEVAEAGRPGISIEDVNGDGADELLLMDGKRLAVIANYGARLLYWFDLQTGMQHVGNQLAVSQAPFKGDSKLPAFEDVPVAWLPERFEPAVNGSDACRVDEAAAARMAKYLPDWVWQDASPATPLVVREMVNGERRPALPAQRRALNDFVTVDGGPELEPIGLLDYRLEDGGVTFIRYLPDRLIMEKRLVAVEDGLRVCYRFDNRTDHPRPVRLRVLSELCPDYLRVLSGGNRALAFVDDCGQSDREVIGVRNTMTGTAVVMEAARRADARAERRALLGLEVELSFDLAVPPQAVGAFDLSLSIRAQA